MGVRIDTVQEGARAVVVHAPGASDRGSPSTSTPTGRLGPGRPGGRLGAALRDSRTIVWVRLSAWELRVTGRDP